MVTFTDPVGTDNCPDATTAQTAGPASGSIFPIGDTTVTYKVTGATGIFVSCSFTVTEKDAEAQVVTATLEPVKVRKEHGCFRVVLYAEDNCDGVIDPSTMTAILNTHEVSNGELVRLHKKKSKTGCRVKDDDGSSG